MTMAISAAYETYTLTSTDLDELFEHAQQQGESILQQTELEVRVNLPKILGEGIGNKLRDRVSCQGIVKEKMRTSSLGIGKRSDNQLDIRFSLAFDNT